MHMQIKACERKIKTQETSVACRGFCRGSTIAGALVTATVASCAPLQIATYTKTHEQGVHTKIKAYSARQSRPACTKIKACMHMNINILHLL